jgi:hypothetical protein
MRLIPPRNSTLVLLMLTTVVCCLFFARIAQNECMLERLLSAYLKKLPHGCLRILVLQAM